MSPHPSHIPNPTPRLHYSNNQGYFCDETHWNAVPEVLSQKGASWNGVPEPLFPGISITNTSPSPAKFWVTLYIPEPIFFRKIALLLTFLGGMYKSQSSLLCNVLNQGGTTSVCLGPRIVFMLDPVPRNSVFEN
jgi:hypothetical protein